jgi:FAD/FMN-containing dehydrogenase
MIAADVHGKNHHKDGSFSHFVQSFCLVTAEGQTKTCSREENTNLFRATIGGMGLTGIITSAKFFLKKIESAFVHRMARQCCNLDKLIHLMDEHRSAKYIVGWIDCCARKSDSWRSIFVAGAHAQVADVSSKFRSCPLSVPKRRNLIVVPTDLPFCLINYWAIKAVNAGYYARNRQRRDIVDYNQFFYPLDGIANWNRLYGKNGLLQFQCAIPRAHGPTAIRAILSEVAESSQYCPLAILKLLGTSEGMLSFPTEGYTLALDFPLNQGTLQLQTKLNRLAARYGGRLYYAKNAVGDRTEAMSGYETSEFSELRRQTGAATRFSSVLSERLAL